MHIVYVNRWFPPETGGGGVATANYNLAKALVAAGHRVSAIALRPNPDVPEIADRDGITVYRVGAINTSRLRRIPVVGAQHRFLQSIVYSRAACAKLAELNARDPVDIAEFAEINAESLFFRKSMARALVIRCHTPTFILTSRYLPSEVPFGTRLFERAERRIIRNAPHLTAPSHDMARMIAEHTPIEQARITVIPNAVEPISDIRPDTHPRDGKLTILFVGRFERVKGLDLVLDVIPAVCAQVPDVQFVLIGLDRARDKSESYGEYIRRTMAQYLASGQLVLRGFVSEAELDAEYRRADICLAPSLLYESFSMTVAQAMAYGKPVISTRTGGIPETLGEAGIAIEPRPEPLANAIVTLATDPTQRIALGAAAISRIAQKFTSPVIAQQTLLYYNQCLPNLS